MKTGKRRRIERANNEKLERAKHKFVLSFQVTMALGDGQDTELL
jgi:ribosomal protein L1